MTTDILTLVFKGSGCLHWCPRQKHIVCRHLCHSTQDISFLKNKVHIYIPPNRTSINTFHEDRIWLNGEKDCNFSNTSADTELAICDISCTDGLCDNRDEGGSSRGEEEGNKHDLEPVMSFAQAHIANGTVKSFSH
jgi:hypothetical protein